MQDGNRRKPVEASLDWKSNGHTTPGPGIEPGLSGPQRGGSTAVRYLLPQTFLFFMETAKFTTLQRYIASTLYISYQWANITHNAS